MSIAVIGGGPAGLRAAECAVAAGVSVTLYEGKRSPGRKFLVAGKSGLNLTNTVAPADFAARSSGGEMPTEFWRDCLADFDPAALRAWALSLEVETFATGGGKVFPVMMKAAPLLRRWIARLRDSGVVFKCAHRWTALSPGAPHKIHFDHDGAEVVSEHSAIVLALGGGSWPETGSDGAWTHIVGKFGIAVAPLTSANCGWECAWTPATLARAEGQPLHNLRVRAGDAVVFGEMMPVRYGIEGTLLYQLGRALRAMENPELRVDFKPSFTAGQLVQKLGTARSHFLRESRARWRLPDAACAILEQLHGEPESAEALARVVKDCRIPLKRPRPLAEAISSAGGVCWSEVDASLMLKKLPGIFVAGEMLDWEAPTGGYLLQGCFATGSRAGAAAARWLEKEKGKREK